MAEKKPNFDCNTCVKKCKKVTSKWPKMRLKPDNNTPFACSTYMEPKPFKMPLLLFLSTTQRKVDGLCDVLKSHKLGISERNYYPYFRLIQT